MSTIETDFGEAGANLGDSHGGIPTHADALRDVADDLADIVTDLGTLNAGDDPAWLTAEVVTTHVWTGTAKGFVAAVEGTTGSSTGAKVIQQSGSPAVGEVTLSFTAGVPTLTFEATDAITAASILFIPAARQASLATTLRTTKG